ncbi:hypothetical protein B566_EDAN014898 [Ephemera danica]|nr:hypothetical protein B566_EDAN014898 [Ephemera danica]
MPLISSRTAIYMQQAVLCLLLMVCGSTTAALHRLREHYAWNEVDFTWPSQELKEEALRTKMFIPENVLPLGVEASTDRLVITLPRWKPGLPATLATVPRNSVEKSPKLTPYPNWLWHQPGNCDGLISVYRVNLDSCNRLWVMDSGTMDAGIGIKYTCPPKLFIFDFTTDNLLVKYELPKETVKDGSFFTNIIVDVVDKQCGLDAFAYMGDVWRFGLVVYNLKLNSSHRIEHEYFYPDPMAAKFTVNGLSFRWPDGIFGLALSPPSRFTDERTLFFHPMASFREFAVSTNILRNSSAEKDEVADLFHAFSPRGPSNEHSSASAMSASGVLFFNLVTRNAVGCWNARLPYEPEFLGIVDADDEALVFPNDMRIDKEQNLWIMSNRLPQFIYKGLNSTDSNFRLLTAPVADAVRGGVCDPTSKPPALRPSFSNLRGLFEAQFGCRLIGK